MDKQRENIPVESHTPEEDDEIVEGETTQGEDEDEDASEEDEEDETPGPKRD